MKGTRIVIAGPVNRVGKYEDIIVVGTPKPGTVMEMLNVAPVGNIFSWGPYGAVAADSGQGVSADGDRKVIAVLTEDDAQGKTYNDAYVTGTRGRIYFPAMGEHLNMLIEDVSGTGDDFVIAEELMVDNGTGKLLTSDADAEAHPFTTRETATDPAADHWMWCHFNGSAG